MKQRTYVDTSVLGGINDPEFQEWSKKLIAEFKNGVRVLVLSDLTLRELENAPVFVRSIIEDIPAGNKEIVTLTDEARTLARTYISEGGISERFLLDAQHIAMATLCRADVLVSWNFKHIVNLKRIRLYNAVNLKNGYPAIEIRSPREVLHDEEGV